MRCSNHSHVPQSPKSSSYPNQSFDFPAPLSFSVGSEFAVSAFRLTGSPSWLGFSSSLFKAFCLSVSFPPFAGFWSPPFFDTLVSVSPSVGEGAIFEISFFSEAMEGFEDCGLLVGFERRNDGGYY